RSSDLGELRECSEIQLLGQGVRFAGDNRQGLGEEAAAPFRPVKVETRRDRVDYELKDGLRRPEEPPEAIGIAARKVVRVGVLWKHRYFDRNDRLSDLARPGAPLRPVDRADAPGSSPLRR